jgi:dsRNA-specific ribonuclease
MPGCLALVDDFCSCNDQISEELAQAKNAAFGVGRELWTHANQLNDYILNGRNEEDLNQAERDSINATLLQAYSAAFYVSSYMMFEP